jgi:serine/threonine protein kinase
MHRDIKTANIFLHFPNRTEVTDECLFYTDFQKDQVEVKLGDFGFSKVYKKSDLNQT